MMVMFAVLRVFCVEKVMLRKTVMVMYSKFYVACLKSVEEPDSDDGVVCKACLSAAY